ncbi:MAG: acyl carrier protein [Oscillibacter sp.]|nr:acyl carrier protein [Oscillibacter sp.]
MSEQMKKEFLGLISQYCEMPENDLKPEMRFREDLGFNSLNFMAFLGDIEDTFDVELDEQKAVTLTTVAEALDYLEELTQEEA